jgi:hypothetical protein
MGFFHMCETRYTGEFRANVAPSGARQSTERRCRVARPTVELFVVRKRDQKVKRRILEYKEGNCLEVAK